MSVQLTETNYSQENENRQKQLAKRARSYIVNKVYNIFEKNQESPEVKELYTFLTSVYIQN